MSLSWLGKDSSFLDFFIVFRIVLFLFILGGGFMQRNTTISSSIRRYKHENDSIALMDIINRMSPLINKYSRSLYSSEYEDIRQELILALLESVNKIKQYDIEEKCISYLAHGIKNRFMELYRKEKVLKEEQLAYDISEVPQISNTFQDAEFYVDIKQIILSEKSITKRKIIELIAYENATDSEIALNSNKFRAICSNRNRA